MDTTQLNGSTDVTARLCQCSWSILGLSQGQDTGAFRCYQIDQYNWFGNLYWALLKQSQAHWLNSSLGQPPEKWFSLNKPVGLVLSQVQDKPEVALKCLVLGSLMLPMIHWNGSCYVTHPLHGCTTQWQWEAIATEWNDGGLRTPSYSNAITFMLKALFYICSSHKVCRYGGQVVHSVCFAVTLAHCLQ